MSDPAQEKTRTFYTVEVVHGESAEVNELACTIVRLGVESAVAMARGQVLSRKHRPEIILHMPGTITA